MTENFRIALQKDKSKPALQFCLLDKTSKPLQECCDLWIYLSFSVSFFLSFYLTPLSLVNKLQFLLQVFCSCPQQVSGKEEWILLQHREDFQNRRDRTK